MAGRISNGYVLGRLVPLGGFLYPPPQIVLGRIESIITCKVISIREVHIQRFKVFLVYPQTGTASRARVTRQRHKRFRTCWKKWDCHYDSRRRHDSHLAGHSPYGWPPCSVG